MTRHNGESPPPTSIEREVHLQRRCSRLYLLLQCSTEYNTSLSSHFETNKKIYFPYFPNALTNAGKEWGEVFGLHTSFIHDRPIGSQNQGKPRPDWATISFSSVSKIGFLVAPTDGDFFGCLPPTPGHGLYFCNVHISSVAVFTSHRVSGCRFSTCPPVWAVHPRQKQTWCWSCKPSDSLIRCRFVLPAKVMTTTGGF